MRKPKIINADRNAEPLPRPRRTFLTPWSKTRFKWVIAYGKKPDYDINWRINLVTILCDGNPLTIAKLAGCAGELMDFRKFTNPEEIGSRRQKLQYQPCHFSHPVRGAYRVYMDGKRLLCPHCGREFLRTSPLSKHLIKVHGDKATATSIDFGLRHEIAKNRVKLTGLKIVKKGGRHGK